MHKLLDREASLLEEGDEVVGMPPSYLCLLVSQVTHVLRLELVHEENVKHSKH